MALEMFCSQCGWQEFKANTVCRSTGTVDKHGELHEPRGEDEIWFEVDDVPEFECVECDGKPVRIEFEDGEDHETLTKTAWVQDLSDLTATFNNEEGK